MSDGRVVIDVDLLVANATKELDKLETKFEKMGKKLETTGKSLTKKVTLPIVGMAGVALKASVDFESAFAGVRKTVDMTEEQYTELSDGIRTMAKEIPVSTTALSGMAEAAGQLGIANEHILSFTRIMADLDVATDMSGDQAAVTFARFANITGMAQKDFDRLGATVVHLGNHFAATESEIAEMSMRIAGAGTQLNMTEADIFGFATALTSVGINPEAGGTAISKLMIEMASDVDMGGERLEEFARIAGMSSKDFQKAFKEDAATAIFTFLGGLGDLSEGGESAFKIIDDLGLSEVRLRDTILRTSNASDVAKEALTQANQAWKDNTALTKEAEERYKTTASQFKIFQNVVMDMAKQFGDILAPVLVDIVNSLTPWIEKLGQLDKGTLKMILVVGGILAAIGPLLIALGLMANGVGAVIGMVKSTVTVVGLLSKALMFLGGPVGLTILAIGALIAIGVLLYKNWDEVAAWLKLAWQSIEKAAKFVFNGIYNFFTGFFDMVFGLFQKGLNFIDSLTGGKFKAITDTIRNYLSMARDNIDAVMTFIKNSFKNGLAFIKALVTLDFKGMGDAIGKQLDNIWGLVTRVWDNITGFFTSIDLWGIGANIIDGLIGGITGKVSDVATAVSTIGKVIKNKITSFFQIKSPSRLMYGLGEFVGEGLANGIDSMKGLVSKTTDSLSKVAVPDITPIKTFSVNVNDFDTDFNRRRNPKNDGGPHKPYGGGSDNQNGNDGIVINIDKMEVRDDEDIVKVSQELERRIRRRRKSLGFA